MPTPLVALPCESRSISKTFFSCWAKTVAILITDVVLPTPPFWLKKENIFPIKPPDVSRETLECQESLLIGGILHPFASSANIFLLFLLRWLPSNQVVAF